MNIVLLTVQYLKSDILSLNFFPLDQTNPYVFKREYRNNSY